MVRTAPLRLVNVDSRYSHHMREQLIREITNLERQLEQLKIGEDNHDISLQQTYREMIQSRRGMLSTLPGAAHPKN